MAKKCVVIFCFANNPYRRRLLEQNIKFFNDHGVDVILASSHHMEKMDNVKNYITINHICKEKYLSDGLFQCVYINNGQYYCGKTYSHIDGTNWFIKLFQICFPYCKNLGYDFCYAIDFDNIVHPKHIPVMFGENLDLSKVYMYPIGYTRAYQAAFFYGDLNLLLKIFSDNNLKKLEERAKKERIEVNEEAMYVLMEDHMKDAVAIQDTEDDVFLKRNMFSCRNSANIYHDKTKNEYWFVQLKGDTCKNEFGCELFLEDKLIHSLYLNETGRASLFKLENDKHYTIKYYDAHISDDTLSRTTHVYTDSTKQNTPHWVVYT